MADMYVVFALKEEWIKIAAEIEGLAPDTA
jgi:hypothetical protein